MEAYGPGCRKKKTPGHSPLSARTAGSQRGPDMVESGVPSRGAESYDPHPVIAPDRTLLSQAQDYGRQQPWMTSALADTDATLRGTRSPGGLSAGGVARQPHREIAFRSAVRSNRGRIVATACARLSSCQS